MARTNFTTPVGRLVQGSLYKPNDKNAEGGPLVVKSGANAGQPRVEYFFALAIPKGPEKHWAETEWGQKIWAAGHAAFPGGAANSPAFAWKVKDGDSQVPNRKGKKPCDQEGFRGHWVLNFSSGFAPRVFNRDGTQAITEEGAVKLGYYIQVNGDVDGNGSVQQPGVFLNHSMVALSAYGEEIVVGPDAASAGFGQAPLPAGAMSTPAGGFSPATPPTPSAPASAPPIPAAAPSASIATSPSNPAFLMPPPPPAAPARQLTPKAGGATYEQLIGAGWTDALLVQHGMMLP